MKKSLIFVSAALVLSLAVIGPAIAEEPEFVMEVGTVAPSGSPWAEQLKRFKKQVQDATDGRLKVKLRLGRGNERSLARRTQMGRHAVVCGARWAA